ncbi:hypothetical protein NDN08_001238 [Rhodosorus marinus]|uniref:Matrin-type domain-containing protein n=1 Tax=Rhodosorus marinus TaxID=101924 RepID=A0AAV8UQ83_9RHOD|nr:hypothetical protein NDN08_001238 [Rhodosorus marinus]
MGKYYCDYCDVYLTHDSPAVRKQHNDGNRHKQAACEYYKEYVGKRTQREIDRVIDEFEVKVMSGLVVPTFGFAEAPVKVAVTGEAGAVAGEMPPVALDPNQMPPMDSTGAYPVAYSAGPPVALMNPDQAQSVPEGIQGSVEAVTGQGPTTHEQRNPDGNQVHALG